MNDLKKAKDNLMNCIICGYEKEESDEHIIPEALGNEKLITKRVCEHCNNRLGSNVDSYLTDHPLVMIIRINNGLKGKKGKPIKFFDGMEIDANSGTKYDMRGGKPKIIPQIVTGSDGKVKVEAASFKDGLAHFKKVLKRKGYNDTQIEAFCEGAYLEERKSSFQAPEFHKDASINFALMELSAIKIAYEYAHQVLGDDYLKDRVAQLFKRELYKAVVSEKTEVLPDDELAKYVTFPIIGTGIELQLKEQREQLSAASMNVLHTIFFGRQGNCLYCILNLCMTDVISFAVQISDNASNYNFENQVCIILENGNVIML